MRLQKIILLLILLFTIIVNNNINANNNIENLSDKSEISLLTCSSGDELYSIFGHSALRVHDDSLGIDIVFNYGTFDFNTPNFYWKFANGRLDYMLSYSLYSNFLLNYKYEKRSVNESIIKLSKEEKQQLWEKLVINAQPENRAYRYDFFFDNCATRIRDAVFEVKKINVSDYKIKTGYTYRDYLHVCLPTKTWTSQGIDLLLGVRADYDATIYDRAYLPCYVDSLFAEANLIESTKTVVYIDDINVNEKSSMFTPLNITLVLLVFTILLTIIERRKHVYFKIFDIFLFTISSLLSILFWYLWLVSDFKITSYNYNVLWASILFIPIVIYLFSKNIFSKKSYLVIVLIICASDIAYILLNIFGIQYAPFLVFPLLLMQILRAISIPNKK